jgi:hypothetical protein
MHESIRRRNLLCVGIQLQRIAHDLMDVRRQLSFRSGPDQGPHDMAAFAQDGNRRSRFRW